MRNRVLRGLAAATLAVTIGVAGTAQAAVAEPAKPTAGDHGVRVQAVDWASLVVAVVSAFANSGGGGSPDLEAAIREIKNAVEAAKIEILNHVDRIASAEVQACARHHTIEFADIDNMPLTVLRLWAQDATGCATLATAFLNAVQSQAAADTIGFAVQEIYAIALAARAKAGFSVNLLLDDLIRTDEAIVVKLLPSCVVFFRPLSPIVPIAERVYQCTEYNGDTASGSETVLGGTLIGAPLNYRGVEDQAARNTSRPIAQAALPTLRAGRP
jgi:hypothetical protein